MKEIVKVERGKVDMWAGLLISGDTPVTEAIKGIAKGHQYLAFTCPCGVETTLAVNCIPNESMLHQCGDPTHWTVKIEP